MTDMDFPFWTWSLEHYAKEETETALLTLQDDIALDVNVLLWCCWCAEEFGTLGDLEIRKGADIARQWTHNVVAPLRSARRYLKAGADPSSKRADSLRDDIKAVELASEKILQRRLNDFAFSALQSNRDTAPGKTNSQSLARRSLASYAALAGAAPNKNFSVSLLDNLVSSIFNGDGYGDEGSDV